MRRFARATATLAVLAPLGLALPVAAEPEPEAAPTPPEKTAPAVPAPAAKPVDDVPPFEAPDPPDFSVIDPSHPPDPTTDLPTPAELEEKAKREAVGRQIDQLRKQSDQGAGKEYFGGGIY